MFVFEDYDTIHLQRLVEEVDYNDIMYLLNVIMSKKFVSIFRVKCLFREVTLSYLDQMWTSLNSSNPQKTRHPMVTVRVFL